MADELESLIARLRKRAEIRRQIPDRKSVQNGESDRLADLLDEAALALERYELLWNTASLTLTQIDERLCELLERQEDV